MIRAFTLSLFFFLFFHTVYSQTATITGTLTSSDDGEPLPGVSVYIKGETTGTVTDIDGRYTIRVSVGQTLVFAFIGLSTQEVKVTAEMINQLGVSSVTPGHKKRNNNPYPSPFYLENDDDEKDEPGVITLREDSPTYKDGELLHNPEKIRSIKKIGNHFIIKPYHQGFAYMFKSSMGFETINKLPEIQTDYAQGRPGNNLLEWFGPDQNEPFTWGPLIKNLEFDGLNYNYDLNGSLVPLGAGNGQSAKTYNPMDFFRTGVITKNEFMVSIFGNKYKNITLDGLYGKQSGIIPNSTVQNKDFNLSLNNYHGIQNLHINSSLKFNESKGNLLLHGGNYAQIIESVYLTPPTFDNANNLSRTLATSNPSSYQLVDNSKRSYAPAYADNPYGLINTIPDHEKFQRISGALNMDYGPPKKITLNFRNLVEKQWNSLLYGMAPGYSRTPLGRITEREDHSTFINSNLSSTYTNPIHEDGELKITLSFQTNYQDYNLSRYEGVGYTMSDFEQRINAQSQNTFDAKIARITYETLFSVFYDYDNFIKSTFSLKKYYSNTLNTQRTNLYPTFNFSFDPNEIIDSYIFDRLKAYVSIGSNIQEASLIYPDKSFLTTDLSVENYHAFYESRELLPQENLSPETEIKFDAGLNIIAFYNLYIDFSYYTHHASNIILPVQTNGIYELTNAASVNHRGTTLSIDYAPYMYDGYLSLGIDFSKGRSLVKEVYNSSTPLSIAGFNTIQRVITPGENYGVIYGTGYLRNANNEIIIDNEGFPIEDNQLRIIGDPTPNWMGAISGQYSINNFEIGILIEHKNGGDRWNGTRAMLDYLGRSTETAELRNTSNHIFEGVDLLGNPNLIPVSFLDTSLPVEKNRWTRYGWDGVGEEYIEDASWTKVSEFSVSHTWRRLPKTKINSIILSGIINNFLMFSKYKGVIPSSNLFGYAQGNGLDLFNTPETRRYSISFTLNF